MMQPAEDWNRRDRADLLRPPKIWSIFIQREMGSDFVVIRSVGLQDITQVRFAEHNEWSSDSRRIDPMSRSTCPFCHGERGAVG
jgi:hypothetical protein